MNDINRIKVELVARFADLSDAQIIKNRHLWDYNALVRNPNIKWSINLLRRIKDEFDWSVAYALKDIKSDPRFIDEFDELINYDNILLLKPTIPWPLDFLIKNKDKFSVDLLIRNAPTSAYATTLFREYYAELGDYELSRIWRSQEFEFDTVFIEEFIEEIDWRALSSNQYFCKNFNLLIEYQDFVNWDSISLNIRDIDIVLKNVEFDKWNWENITCNKNFIPILQTIPEFNKIVWSKVPMNKWLPGERIELSRIFKSYMRFIDSSEKHSEKYFFTRVFMMQAVNAQEIYDLLKSSGKSQELIDYLASVKAFRNVSIKKDDFDNWFIDLRHDDRTFVYLNKHNYEDDIIDENISFVKDLLSKMASKKPIDSIPLSKQIIKKHGLKLDISNQLKYSKYKWEWEEIEELNKKMSISSLGSKKVLFDQLIQKLSIDDFLKSLDSPVDHGFTENENKQLDYNTKLASKYYNKAVVKGNENDFIGAKEFCDMAIEADPNFFLAYNDRGLCKHFMGEYEDAIDDFNQALILNKNDYFYYCRGNTFLAMKKYESAIEDYDKAIELKSDVDTYYLNRGNAYAGSGNHVKAIDDYTESIDLNRHPGTFKNRAMSYKELGDEENATKDMQWAILFSSVKEKDISKNTESMKTSLDDQVLMHNLPLPISKENLIELLERNNFKPIVKEIVKREVLIFHHDVYFIEAAGLSMEGSTQKTKYVKISQLFDKSGMLESQTIRIESHSFHENSIGKGYELIDPFLSSSDWNLLRKEVDPTRNGLEHRISKYLLENETKGLLLSYNQGDSMETVN